MNQNLSRRKFLSAVTISSTAYLMSPSALAFERIVNQKAAAKIKVAVMGVNGRGLALVQAFAANPVAEVTWICDVDSRALSGAIQAARSAGQSSVPNTTDDFRKALDDRSVDALVIAAPDHWHTPAALLGLKAGKHIYVEKPGSHNPAEGELLVPPANRYQKKVQLGNQRRSWPRVGEAIAELQSGSIGKVDFARVWYTNNRPSIGIGKNLPVPEWLNYDLWQGPAPRCAFKDNLIHYNWHWHWNWGTGELLNNGTHFMDLARWGMNVNYPTSVYSTGGRFQFQDDWETPDTQTATYRFADGKIIQWEGRSCNPKAINEMGSGVSFHGTQGSLEIRDNSYRVYNQKGEMIRKIDSGTNTVVGQTGPGFDFDKDHVTNFLEAIQSGARLNSPIQECNKSVLLCHLGNISYRSGTALTCDPDAGKIINNPEAMKYWTREYQPGWEPKIG